MTAREALQALLAAARDPGDVREAGRVVSALVARAEYRDPEQVRGDYETVARALSALSSAWAYDRPPTTEEGMVLVTEATLALSCLAVAAGIPTRSS